jgi:hypothetical protein
MQSFIQKQILNLVYDIAEHGTEVPKRVGVLKYDNFKCFTYALSWFCT